jgi:hypothetical protein
VRLTHEDISNIERAFCIPVNGPWNKLAVTYVGLSFPLVAGWKMRLLRDGVAPDSPVAQGIDPIDWRWMHAEYDTDDDMNEISKKVSPEQYVLLRVDALEMVLNDVRTQCEDLKKQIRALRDMTSKDEW